MKKKAVTIVVPAFNEEDGIESVLSGLVTCLRKSDLEHEIILVNDGSSDNTGLIASSISGIRIIKHDKNRGYGA